MQTDIIALILNQAAELNDQLTKKIPLEQGPAAPLFGGEGVLDSIALVTLIVAIEQALEDELDVVLTLADEKAMSQQRSPFQTVETLASYIQQRLMEAEV